ncbi:alpha/beta fold hydrolase [Nocardia sp. 2]|uniref:Alpha/beta fold hydrolase n=1 Tax=Nocardia acididurans TaxID=2802282 RepID=A0ABS1MAX8_9NOCA|nr:alpha/beta fold hydrolase [Nocardia acididurans]MBL1077726.1 alpha/beta fold hydrolase [Nocardia acididurans]
MTKRKGLAATVSAALAAATLAGVLTACGSGDTAAATPAWCPTVPGHRVDCGTISRPLVDGRADLGEISVAYARVQRSDTAAPAAGTITPNPGGPGVPLISHAPEAVAMMGPLLDSHDLLLIDPRGTGESSALDCGADERVYQLGTREQQRDMVTRCGERIGEKALGYTSAATADDFDAVREHLGVRKLVLYGISYGTYLMPIYAQRHPDSVQSMVLSGAYPWEFDTLNRPNAEAVSTALQRICERSGACDGETAVSDLKTVAARLRERPLEVGGDAPVRLDEKKLASLLFETGTSEVGMNPAAPTLLGAAPAVLHAAAQGDDEPLRQWTVQATAAPSYENIDLYMTVACNDYGTLWSPNATVPQREQQYRQALDQAGTIGAFSAAGFSGGQRDGGDACLGWPANGLTRPADVRTALPDVPVLVISGDLDAITPDANGQRVAAKFPRATFISVPNTGHVPDMEPSGCVAGIIGQFIATGTPGASECVAAVPPIAVTPVVK